MDVSREYRSTKSPFDASKPRPQQPARSNFVAAKSFDAGSGYAGLQQILRLQPDVIKLDLDLTQGISTGKARRALAAATVSLSRDLEATLVADGVETEPDLRTLRNLGVSWGQGYLLGRHGQLPEKLSTVARGQLVGEPSNP